MKSLAANLSTLFTDVPFLERFALAREAGFLWVECQFPYVASAAAVGLVMKRAGVRLVLLNLPADGVSAQGAWRTLVDNIRFAADALSTHGGGLRILPQKHRPWWHPSRFGLVDRSGVSRLTFFYRQHHDFSHPRPPPTAASFV